MFQAKSPGAGLLRLSVTGVVCLSLATSLWAQDSRSQRVLHQPDSVKTSSSAKAPTVQFPRGPAATGKVIQPQVLQSTPGFTPVGNDEPDFAPMEETFLIDGEARTPKLVRKGNPYVLAFVGGSYAPARGIDPRLMALYETDPKAYSYGYVMIRGRMADTAKVSSLKKLGVKFLGVHTYQSYLAKIPLAQLPQIGALPFVHWVGYAQPDQKLEPRLLKDIQKLPGTERYQIDISLFDSDIGPQTVYKKIGEDGGNGKALIRALEVVIPNGRMQKKLEALGFEFEHYTDVGNVYIFEGWATADQILEIRKLDFVSYIEKKQVHGLNHDQSVAMIGQDRVRGYNDGGPITLGIIDTGVTHSTAGNPYKTHMDLNKQMLGWSNVTGQSAYADGHGHGSHVAGTMIGEGKADRRYMGNAPGVARTTSTRFFVGRYFDSLGKPKGSVSTLYYAFRKSWTLGGKTTPRPRAINNSWGSDGGTTKWNGTESGARTVDSYVYNYNQTYVFSSGNKGNGVGSPSSAKNALTVGSVDDHWSGSVKPGDLSSFSRFYTGDSRRKPEIVAPGSVVTSVRTKTTNLYTNMSGTSMASPHMTGSIASFLHKWGSFDYKPYMIKAQAMAAASWQGNPGTSTGYWGGPGFGLIDTRKMWWSTTRYSWTAWNSGTSLNASGKYVYSDFTVPSTVTNAKLVMSFIEQASGSGATKARVCDVRVYIDVWPFTAGGNTGEYSILSSRLTNLSKAGTSFANAIKGKKIRIKIYAQSVPSGYLPKAGWTLFYYMKPTSGNPTLSAYASPSKVKPGQLFYWYATLRSGVNTPEFSNARIYPNFSSLFPIQYMYRYTLDRTPIYQMYSPTSSYPSSPYPSLSRTTSGGMTVGSGDYRWLAWRLKAPTSSNNYSLASYAMLDPLSGSYLYRSGTVCVDGLAPNTVSGLTSTTHPAGIWRNTSAFLARWRTPTDSGCAGIGGLAYLYTTSPTSVPTVRNITGAATSRGLTLGNTSGSYFHIRAVDAVGNLSGTTSRYGPIRVDLTNPSISSVSINRNAPYTRSLSVLVAVSATDTYSGPAYARFSSNGSTWSNWSAYTPNPQTYLLNSYGGSTNQGLKRVYVQVRDRAGNLSSSRYDTIVYDSAPPLLSSVRINLGLPYTRSSTVGVMVTGSGASHVRYSFNGTTWSPLYTYTMGTRSFSVGSFGGNTNQGVKTVYVRLYDLAGNASITKSDSIIYDSIAPNVSLVRIDNGAAFTKSLTVGVQVLGTGGPARVQYSFNGSTWSPWMSYTTGNRNMLLTSYGGNSLQGTKTVYARLTDAAGNVSRISTDTIVYDKTAPVVRSVSINAGAPYTSSATVSVRVIGLGSPTQVQYSFNNSTWSPWMSYTTGSRSMSVTNYGGNANTGTKTVYARLRDGALNVSATRSDSIVYLKIPRIVTASGTTSTVIHDNRITLTGSGFGDVNRAYFGSVLITSTSAEDWHRGYFKILSDSKMEVYPPQNLLPANYTCYVRNTAYRSANYVARIVHNTTSKTGVPTILKSGKVLHVYTHRGPKPATTVSILTFSASPKPLIVPGLISLGHGGNTTSFIDPSFTIISPGQVHNPVLRTAHWAFPTPPGAISGTLYWQSVMFDAANPTKTPIPVSTTDSVKFYK